jgi:hypothetical protein
LLKHPKLGRPNGRSTAPAPTLSCLGFVWFWGVRWWLLLLLLPLLEWTEVAASETVAGSETSTVVPDEGSLEEEEGKWRAAEARASARTEEVEA